MSRKTKIPEGQDLLFGVTSGRFTAAHTNQANVPKEHIDLEGAIKRYLSQFSHRRCGGNPVAYIHSAEGSFLACSKCDFKQRVGASEPLGESLTYRAWERK